MLRAARTDEWFASSTPPISLAAAIIARPARKWPSCRGCDRARRRLAARRAVRALWGRAVRRCLIAAGTAATMPRRRPPGTNAADEIPLFDLQPRPQRREPSPRLVGCLAQPGA